MITLEFEKFFVIGNYIPNAGEGLKVYYKNILAYISYLKLIRL